MRRLLAWALLSGCATISWVMAAAAPEGMVLVPAGAFVMGADEGAYDEAPPHRVHVSAFYIDRHEVTNEQFAKYVRDTEAFDRIEGPWFRHSVEGCLDTIAYYEKRHGTQLEDVEIGSEAEGQDLGLREEIARWRAATVALEAMLGASGASGASGPPRDEAVTDLVGRQARLPVRGVTWRDAAGYAKWSGKRLPTEAEWEKAARGMDERTYPWGNDWEPGRGAEGLDGPEEVGRYPQGASPYGCLDMAGNVWEWVADWYGEAYYAVSQDSRDPQGPRGLPDGRLPSPTGEVYTLRTPQQGRESDTRKVVRGGGGAASESRARFDLRTTRRMWSNPSYWHPDVGFRCAKDAN